MTPATILTVTISVISLVVAIGTAYKTYMLSTQQLRLANRNEFQKLLIDLNREVIRDPSLWAIYDDHPVVGTVVSCPALTAKLEAFAYMKINIFEMIFLFFHATGDLSKAEQGTWQVWESFFKYTIKKSSIVRKCLDRPDIAEYYPEKFVEYTRIALAQWKAQQGRALTERPV